MILLFLLVPVAGAAGETWSYNATEKTLTCIVDGETITLKEVTADGTNLTIGQNHMDLGDSDITTLDLSGSISSNDGTSYTITAIGGTAFDGCTSLPSVTLPTGVKTIEDTAFNGCESLKFLDLPDSLKSIGDGAFSNCTILTSIDLPDGVTTIGELAFYECTSLTFITLPTGLKSIEKRAFDSCKNLTSLIFRSEMPPTLGTDALKDTNDSLQIYVPDDAMEAYKNANGWGSYADQISATPDIPSSPSNPPSYTIVRPDGFLASGAEYWAEAPGAETESTPETDVDAGKDNPSMGGAHDAVQVKSE